MNIVKIVTDIVIVKIVTGIVIVKSLKKETLKYLKNKTKKMFVFARVIFFMTFLLVVSAHMTRFEKQEILIQSWIVTQIKLNIG